MDRIEKNDINSFAYFYCLFKISSKLYIVFASKAEILLIQALFYGILIFVKFEEEEKSIYL